MSLDDKMFNFNESRQVSDGELAEISRLAAALQDADGEVEAMEATLSGLKEKRDRIKFTELPLAMDKVGMEKFTMKDGRIVNVKGILRLNISAQNHDAAYGWLRQNGAEPLIKNEIKAVLPKGEDETARELVRTLTNMGVQYTQKESIPWNTLSAWAKEQIEEGKKLPAELLGLYIGREAVVK